MAIPASFSNYLVALHGLIAREDIFKYSRFNVVRSGHPRIKNGLSAEEYVQETHIQVAITGTGHSILEKTLEARRMRRREVSPSAATTARTRT